MEIIILAAILIASFYAKHLASSFKEAQEIDRENQTLLMIRSAIKPHAKTLALKHEQLIYEDDYGNFVFDKWDREVNYFIKNTLSNDPTSYHYLTNSRDSHEKKYRLNIARKIIFDVAHEELLRQINEAPEDQKDVDSLTGDEFERHCASILRGYGWTAKTTQATSDQGIDIIAKINGVKAVFQCKRYSQPVGNSAVQEAIAGKSFARADVAAVITNSTFTRSAKQLAQSTNVYLIHHTEIGEFTDLIVKNERQ